MKRIFSVFLLIALFTTPFYAQTPEQPIKKVYRSEENKLFINKDLGVYIWLSTSPDTASEKHRLVSESSKKYTNPMFFDTEGYNTVRSPWEVDTSTKRVIYPLHDIIFEVYADGLPPVSKAVYKYTTTKYIDGKRYYDSNLKIDLQSYDAVSGVETIWYNLNSDKYTIYKKPITTFKEGENILRFYAIDKVGNMEDMHEEKFYIDKVPPKTSYQIEGNTSDKYVSANALIKLTSKDDFSGVNKIYYKINNGSFVRYTTPIPVSLLSDDQSSITFYSEDNLGNKENYQTIGGKNSEVTVEEGQPEQNIIFEFYIDKDPPEVSLEVNSDIFKGNYTYISPRTLFTIKAEDEKAGVEKIQYSINSRIIDTEYKEPFVIENKGLQYVRIRAVDYVGNNSTPVLNTYYCDPNTPKTSLLIGSPKFLSRDTLFVSSKTPFTITSKDEGAGIAAVYYSVNDATPIEYEKVFTLDISGPTVLNYYATDKVNNKEEKKATEVFVDNELPAIHYHFSVESIGNKIVRDENYTIYPTNVMLYIAVTDKHSGGEKIEYTINDGTLQTTNPIKSLTPGNYLIEVSAYDMLENKNTQEIKFAVEE